ncbi:MAG: DsbA family oxidoreductase [Chitinophagaceae bacterium]
MQVDIWSDTRCPFCYIGKRKFEKALAKFPYSDKINVEWHSFELDPNISTQKGVSIHDYLSEIKGISRESSIDMHDRVKEAAGQVGLNYNFDTTVVANSFDAHRLIQLAKQKGLGDAAEERLFKAYFTEGKDISDHLTLIILGNEIGLDGKLIKQMLDSDDYAFEVRQDEKMAQTAGIRGVPYFVFNNRYAVSGAQEPEVFLKAMEKAWTEYEQSSVSV